MARIDICTDDDFKAQWAEYSKGLGLSAGAAARVVLENHLGALDDEKHHPEIPDDVFLKVMKGTEREPKKRINVWLTMSEMNGLKAIAHAIDESMSHILASAARGILTRKAQVLNHEMEVFRESNYLLDSMASDLSMIARTNQLEGHTGIAGFISHVRKHTSMVDDTLKSCAERWVLR